MPCSARVALILEKYASLGVVPVSIPPILTETVVPIQGVPIQQGKDLEYVRALAQEVGYVFFIEPGPLPGSSIGYWGPEVKFGRPQPALNVNMDVYTNVESLNFSYNTDQKVLPILTIYNQETKASIPIPIPEIPMGPPLALIPPIPKQYEFIDVSRFSAIRAAMVGLALATHSSDSTTATGSL